MMIEQYYTIIDEAQRQSPMVASLMNDSYAYYQQLIYDQQWLLGKNADAWTASTPDPHELQDIVLHAIEYDYYAANALKDIASTCPGGHGPNTVTWSLKTNKMPEALLGAKAIIEDWESFTAIVHGEYPEHIDPLLTDVIFLGPSSYVLGSAETTFLSTAILEVYFALHPEDHGISDIMDDANSLFVDSSALAHVTPIPDFIADDVLGSQFKEHFNFYFSDMDTPSGLAFVHSGYAFGGQREETRYGDEGKLFGPEDCSSWIGKIVDCEHPLTTIDELYLSRMLTGEGVVPNHWLYDTECLEVAKFLDVVDVHSIDDIQAGQIYSIRNVAIDDQIGIGSGGHTGIVLGPINEAEVLVLSYSREMPEIEGFGVSSFPIQSDEKQIHYFSILDTPRSDEEVLALRDIYLDDDIQMMTESPLLAQVLMPISETTGLDVVY